MRHDEKALIILSPGFPKNEADTTCLPSQQVFIKALNKNFPGLKIIILSFQYPFSLLEYEWCGNTVIPFNGLKSGLKARMRLWRKVWAVLNMLKKKNNLIGVFSFWFGECAFIGKWFASQNHLRHFGWISGQDAKKGNKYIRFIRPKAGELVAMSDFLAKEFMRNYAVAPLNIIPNAIDPSMFSPQTVERDIAVLGVGSLIPLKQYEIFISAVEQISKTVPVSNAALCGKGPEQIHLQKLIEQSSVQNIINLIGEKPHQETLALMQRSKVFLHTSSYEGFSTVCLEALYAGCHVISFIKPMDRDIDHWHIVRSEKEMVEKAIDILRNPVSEYTKVVPYIMDDTARSVMKLFGYKPPVIS